MAVTFRDLEKKALELKSAGATKIRVILLNDLSEHKDRSRPQVINITEFPLTPEPGHFIGAHYAVFTKRGGFCAHIKRALSNIVEADYFDIQDVSPCKGERT